MKALLHETQKRVFAALLLVASVLGAATSQAATITADFNGDGRSDTATITAASGSISIAHGGGGTTSYGLPANWLTISAVELNGTAGLELVASYAGTSVWVVDDRIRTTRLYLATPAGAGRVIYFSEMNGVAGNEVAFINNDGTIWVIDDRARKTRLYNVPAIGSGGGPRYVKIGEFNGTAGNEIMFSYVDGRSYVVDDRLHATRAYFYLSDGGPPTYANVDGVAGLEAIFNYTFGKIWVVDRTRKVVYR
ncbi:MAG: hypothetical protein KA144_15750 [Xanthomonadaceae bacterium]|nr:hypothetical protein [Xanthomonadaceae bacterium]